MLLAFPVREDGKGFVFLCASVKNTLLVIF